MSQKENNIQLPALLIKNECILNTRACSLHSDIPFSIIYKANINVLFIQKSVTYKH